MGVGLGWGWIMARSSCTHALDAEALDTTDLARLPPAWIEAPCGEGRRGDR